MRTEVAPQAEDWKAFEPSTFSLAILRALNLRPVAMYAGSVPAKTKARRRAANRMARTSRRINRR